MKQTAKTGNGQFLGFYILSYVFICSIFIGQMWTAILFIIWLLLGWMISRLISDFFILGSDLVKTYFTVFLYFGVLGLTSLISIL